MRVARVLVELMLGGGLRRLLDEGDRAPQERPQKYGDKPQTCEDTDGTDHDG
jgi:hypothetical protein